MKKFFTFLAIIITVSLTVIMTAPEEASAFTGKCRSFLGLTSWDCNVTITDDNNLKSGIWVIASNVATDIAIIATYLILGYVIYGGYLYTFSAGDPGKAATAKKTLAQAFIGLAIVMLANVIMGSIRITLAVKTGGKLINCANESCVNPNTMITSLVNWFITISGVVSAIFLVYGGISYITSAGDANKAEKGKKMITYSLIGLIIVGLSATISAYVSSKIRSAAYLNQTIISKEVNENQTN